MWFVLALGTAVFFAAQSATVKRLGDRYHPDVIVCAAYVISAPVFIVILLFSGIPEIQPGFWKWLALSLSLNLVAIPMFFRALERGQLSVVLPLVTLTPLFSLVTEKLLMGENPTGLGFLGIFLIVMGAYLINASDIRHGLLAPIKALARDEGARLTLVTAVLWSVCAVADRGAVLTSSPQFYQAAFTVIFSVLMLVYLLITDRPGLTTFISNPAPLLLVALFGIGLYICQMAALEQALAALVISVKRLAALFGVLLGSLLFKEQNLSIRLTAALIMVTGTVLLIPGTEASLA
jgi:drug/metabolite transporter (DMT)-like permease